MSARFVLSFFALENTDMATSRLFVEIK